MQKVLTVKSKKKNPNHHPPTQILEKQDITVLQEQFLFLIMHSSN